MLQLEKDISIDDIRNIACYFRQTPQTSVSIKSLDALHGEVPECILLQDCTAEEKWGVEALEALFSHLPKLERILEEKRRSLLAEVKPRIEDLPTLPYLVAYQDQVPLIAGAINTALQPHERCFGMSDKSFFYGHHENRTYFFPSGRQVDYFLLEEDISCNMSVFRGAGFMSPDEGIFVRKSCMDSKLAFQRIHRPTFEGFDPYAHILSHEYIESKIGDQLEEYFEPLPKELMVEYFAKRFALENGISEESYSYYHWMNRDDDETNFSNVIVANNFEPGKGIAKQKVIDELEKFID